MFPQHFLRCRKYLSIGKRVWECLSIHVYDSIFIDQSGATHSFICSWQDELTSLIRHESDVWRGFIQRHADMVSKAGTYEDP